MSRSEADAELPPVDDAPADPAGLSGAAVEPDPDTVQRRAFVRKMTNDAVGIAGTLFNVSRILTRSAVAAGEAVIGELEGLQPGNAAEETAEENQSAGPASRSDSTSAAPASGRSAAPEPAAPGPSAAEPGLPPSRPVLLLDADQRAILEAATSAIVAVNREGFPPQLTAASVAWDGETLRFATLGWSRRTTMLRADPNVGLLVEGPGDGRFVTVAGRAQIREGREAREAMWPLLLREAGKAGEAGANSRWEALVAEDPDRAVIVVEPDQVLSGRH
jgi:nitroimidazol reductase NimA-like FMN-containing flavoprotein (pyridoxamine 5'-phosphate oxidase superfamily)